MKNKFLFLFFFASICGFGFSQEVQELKTQLTNRPIESKHFFATWRTDYYI